MPSSFFFFHYLLNNKAIFERERWLLKIKMQAISKIKNRKKKRELSEQ